MALQAEGSPLVAAASPQAPAAPAAGVRVRVLHPFRLPGQDDPQPGDELQLPRSLVAELVMYGRVAVVPTGDAVAPAAKRAAKPATKE